MASSSASKATSRPCCETRCCSSVSCGPTIAKGPSVPLGSLLMSSIQASLSEAICWAIPAAMKEYIERAVAFLQTSTAACGVTPFMGLIEVGLPAVPTRARREIVSSR